MSYSRAATFNGKSGDPPFTSLLPIESEAVYIRKEYLSKVIFSVHRTIRLRDLSI